MPFRKLEEDNVITQAAPSSGFRPLSAASSAVDEVKKELEPDIQESHPIEKVLKGFGGAGASLFKRTGELVGGAAGIAGELGASALDKNVREQMLNSSPEDFKRMFPFLGKYVDLPAAKAAEEIGGKTLGAATELAPALMPIPGTAAGRVAAGSALGTISGGANAMAEGKSPEDIIRESGKGAAIGAAVSGFGELLAKAGETLPKKLWTSALDVRGQKDIARAERLVDDKTLAERLAQEKFVGTNKQILSQLDDRAEADATALKNILSPVKAEIPGEELTKNLTDLLYDEKNPLSQESRDDIAKAIEKYEGLYREKKFSALDLLGEKRGLGADLGEKGFTTDPAKLREAVAETKVQRKLYDNLKSTIETISGVPEQVRELNDKLSTWIDAKKLLKKAGQRGTSTVEKLIPFMLGTAQATMGGGIKQGALTGAAAFVGEQALRSTLLKTISSRVASETGKALSSEAAQRLADEIISQIMQKPASSPED